MADDCTDDSFSVSKKTQLDSDSITCEDQVKIFICDANNWHGRCYRFGCPQFFRENNPISSDAMGRVGDVVVADKAMRGRRACSVLRLFDMRNDFVRRSQHVCLTTSTKCSPIDVVRTSHWEALLEILLRATGPPRWDVKPDRPGCRRSRAKFDRSLLSYCPIEKSCLSRCRAFPLSLLDAGPT